jgi:hypothetical protein
VGVYTVRVTFRVSLPQPNSWFRKDPRPPGEYVGRISHPIPKFSSSVLVVVQCANVEPPLTSLKYYFRGGIGGGAGRIFWNWLTGILFASILSQETVRR